MVSKKVVLKNAMGFHMRPASSFTAKMIQYPCEVTIRSGEKTANGKSLMTILAACLKCGAELEIECSGEREQEALQAAVELIESGFGE